MEEQLPINPTSPIAPDPILQKKKSHTKLYIFIVIASVVLTLGITTFFLTRPSNSTEVISTAVTGELEEIIPTPTPPPFYELTIPYLRNREYNSTMGELDQVASNGNYTSYLTNYYSDGNSINAQLTIPTSQKPTEGFPAIIFIHGYIPPAQYQTLVNYSSYVDYLARQGFAVFKIDLRGHGDSEGEPGGAYYSSDYIIDVLNAKAALQGQDQINPEAIGLWGHSMAGNVVFRTLAVDPTIPAAVIWAGAVYSYEDWQEYGIDDGSYRPPANNEERQRRRQELFDTHGEFSKDNAFWKTVAATNYIKDMKTALQLNHAIDDAVVDIGYSRDLSSLLGESDLTHELHEYSSGGHNISGSSFNAAMSNTSEFFQKYL